MRYRVGIGLSANTVRVVVLKRQRIVWSAERAVPVEQTLEAVLFEVLTAAPIPKWRRCSACISVGPSLAIVRKLTGLPPVSTDALALELMRSNADRFLPRLPETSHVAAVRLVEPGVVWAATANSEAIEAVQRACEHARVRLDTFAPSCMVLSRAAADQGTDVQVNWSDGTASVDVTLTADGRVEAITRLSNGHDRPEGMRPRLAKHLNTLGPDAWSYADAYGAALLGRKANLAFRLPKVGGSSSQGRVPRLRLMIAAFVFLLGLIAALAAPILGAKTLQTTDKRRLNEIADSARAAATVEGELRSAQSRLRAMAEFQAARRSPSFVLATLTRVLPHRTALVAFRIDSAGVSLVAIGANVMTALAALDTTRGFGEFRATSPVTRESVNGVQVERVSVAFAIRQEHLDWSHARGNGDIATRESR